MLSANFLSNWRLPNGLACCTDLSDVHTWLHAAHTCLMLTFGSLDQPRNHLPSLFCMPPTRSCCAVKVHRFNLGPSHNYLAYLSVYIVTPWPGQKGICSQGCPAGATGEFRVGLKVCGLIFQGAFTFTIVLAGLLYSYFMLDCFKNTYDHLPSCCLALQSIAKCIHLNQELAEGGSSWRRIRLAR